MLITMRMGIGLDSICKLINIKHSSCRIFVGKLTLSHNANQMQIKLRFYQKHKFEKR